ncbi:cytochrome c, mono- and diheme variants family [Belliella baltica DSM 15883]|uniref:Cytochrome c, mono-and diheme variants family n=1 Tax=Belliella baltica (strain DSM 15883 / CIP 108006 / LMG 21964 / BA134) TaxID=866536 RepID=I3ZAK8_BELBD|nr:c-type cytochrome [Belliella baltica]AFL86276.1 cytochrome c, mono- and diheme variants family [Belliella baltica DSM 15883]
MKLIKSIYVIATAGVALGLASCGASGDNPGYEYAPQMYNSVPYEGLTQIVNEDEGQWLSTREDEKGEFFNSNVNNPNRMNMREPVANTVPRTKDGMLPYRLKAFELEKAAEIQNPVELTDQVLAEGQQLYLQYCTACHGINGEGDGLAGQVIGGVANLKGGAYVNLPEGHIFHVIMKGKGRMGAHGSQIPQERIWKIVHYVKQEIQKQ